MPLAAGQTLTHYEILGPLGAGGMGEVYRARDTRLEREVAIKVLPEHFADDEERLRRFEREAKTLASLSHPNVAGIHGIDQVGDTCFLAMELVPGEDLATRLARGRLPVDEALDVCRQIAEGLEAAHEAGVVHRDLKPANVRVTPEGVVKILDFGLAKPIRPKAREDGTTTAESDSFLVTEEGLVLGTPTYMSPEQARGKPVDRRTDIWAFGCVLYECLTGARAFQGDSLSDVIAAVLEREPDLDALPATTPLRVRKLLRRALTKEARQRLRDIGEARVVLAGSEDEPVAAAPPRSSAGLLLIPVAALAAALATWWWGAGNAETPSASLRRFDRQVEGLEPALGVALSEDGERLGYVADGRVWVWELGQLDPVPVQGSARGLRPAFSPDGEHVAFAIDSSLWRAPTSGGAARRIATLPQPIAGSCGIAWYTEDRIAVATGDSDIFECPAQGGEPTILVDRDPTVVDDFHDVTSLPGGRGIVYTVHRRSAGADQIAVFDGTETHIVVDAPGSSFQDPHYASPGHLVFTRTQGGTEGLWAVPFSLDRMEATGPPFLLTTTGKYSSAGDSLLVYSRMSLSPEARLSWIDRSGNVLEDVGRPQVGLRQPVVSPERDRVAVSAREGGQRDIWLHWLDRDSPTRFTFSTEGDHYALWVPRRNEVIWTTGGGGQGESWIRAADGSSEPRPLGISKARAVTPDGSRVLFEREDDAVADIWFAPIDGGAEPTLVVGSTKGDRVEELSPDGSLLLFRSDRTGQDELYVTTFPDGKGLWPVSSRGGQGGHWSPDGDAIYYRDNDENLYEVRISTANGIELLPQELVMKEPEDVSFRYGFAVGEKGERFLVVRQVDEGARDPSLVVVENWAVEFKER